MPLIRQTSHSILVRLLLAVALVCALLATQFTLNRHVIVPANAHPLLFPEPLSVTDTVVVTTVCCRFIQERRPCFISLRVPVCARSCMLCALHPPFLVPRSILRKHPMYRPSSSRF